MTFARLLREFFESRNGPEYVGRHREPRSRYVAVALVRTPTPEEQQPDQPERTTG